MLNEALNAAQDTPLTVDPRIYITGPRAPPTNYATGSDSESGSISAESPVSEKENKLPLYTALRITHGRPSLRKVFDEEVTTAAGPVSVDGMSSSPSRAPLVLKHRVDSCRAVRSLAVGVEGSCLAPYESHVGPSWHSERDFAHGNVWNDAMRIDVFSSLLDICIGNTARLVAQQFPFAK